MPLDFQRYQTLMPQLHELEVMAREVEDARSGKPQVCLCTSHVEINGTI